MSGGWSATCSLNATETGDKLQLYGPSWLVKELNLPLPLPLWSMCLSICYSTHCLLNPIQIYGTGGKSSTQASHLWCTQQPLLRRRSGWPTSGPASTTCWPSVGINNNNRCINGYLALLGGYFQQ